MRAAKVTHNAASLLGAMARELGSRVRWRQRGLDELEALLSVLLAIVIAHALGATNIGWAAFTGFMVMRAQLAETLERGAARLLGTALGAAAGWVMIVHVADTPVAVALALLVLGTGTLYAAITQRYSNSWLFTGLTFAMVVLDSLKQPQVAVHAFALTRMLEVAAGTAAGFLVNLASAWTVRPRIQGPQHFFAGTVDVATSGWQRTVARHSLVAGVVLGMLPLLSPLLGASALVQAAITIMAVMTVPLVELDGDARAVGTRIAHRFAGCALGALAAAFALLVSHHHLPLSLALLCLGVWAGRHIENSGKSFAYIGTQFAVVFLVVSVPDDFRHIDSTPGWERLSGIVLGIALLVPARAAARWLGRRYRRKGMSDS